VLLHSADKRRPSSHPRIHDRQRLSSLITMHRSAPHRTRLVHKPPTLRDRCRRTPCANPLAKDRTQTAEPDWQTPIRHLQAQLHNSGLEHAPGTLRTRYTPPPTHHTRPEPARRSRQGSHTHAYREQGGRGSQYCEAKGSGGMAIPVGRCLQAPGRCRGTARGSRREWPLQPTDGRRTTYIR